MIELAIWAGTMAAAWWVLRWATERSRVRSGLQPNKHGDRPSQAGNGDRALECSKHARRRPSQAGINGPEPSLSKPVDGPRRAIPYASPPATRPLEYFYGADSVTTVAPKWGIRGHDA